VSYPEGGDADELDPGTGPVIRDKRRIDPDTGQVRVPAEGVDPAPDPDALGSSEDPTPGASTDELAERTADLQRVSAEYANYRKRVDRDRQAMSEQALANVLIGLLPILDDIARARDHGELDGGFRSVAEGLESTLAKLGLEQFGLAGEPFDPTVHEALTHGYSAEVSEPTCAVVLQSGYRLGERVLRPARVAVVEPGDEDWSAPGPDEE
jgi:molecular chaperone GrpE